MRVPTLVIVGRPNVGKSSILNRFAGRKVSIVDPTAGTTRDRVETLGTVPGERFGEDLPVRLVDTGGYGIVDRDDLGAVVERQIFNGLAEADLVLFVVDAQEGVMPLDQTFAKVLREAGVGTAQGKQVMVVANKVDGPANEPFIWDAMQLGFGEPVGFSAVTKHGYANLAAAIRARIDWSQVQDASLALDEGVRVAVVGKRNAGKSTITNALAGADRVIVSEREGTTRDSVDVRVELGSGRVVTLIDTAGLRRTKSLDGDLEYYSQHRSLRSVRRADVCLLLIDATVPVSQVDELLVQEITKHHRPCVILINKWDLVEHSHNQDEYVEYLDRELKGLPFAPIVFTSALKAEGVKEALAMALNLHEQTRHRMSTSELNAVLEGIMADNPPRSKSGKVARVYYATQIEVDPPTVCLFVNDADHFDNNYLRFLENAMREVCPWSEVPIKLLVRGKEKREIEQRLEEKALRKRDNSRAGHANDRAPRRGRGRGE